MAPSVPMDVLVCRAVTCTTHCADDVYRAFRQALAGTVLAQPVRVERMGCTARCGGGVTVVVRPSEVPALALSDDPFAVSSATPEEVVYPEVSALDVPLIVREHLQEGRPMTRLMARAGEPAR